MNKYFALLSIMAFFLFIFIGCNIITGDKIQNSLIKSDSINKIKIRWLAQWYGEGKKELLIREIARDFSFLNQNIDVELEFPHEMAKIKPTEIAFKHTVDTIAKMVKTNECPYDIMLCDADIYKVVGENLKDPYWGRKYLTDFSKEPWFIKAHKDNFFNAKVYTEKYGGIAPGAYIEGIWQLLYVSSDVENRLGIKIKTRDMSMNDFISYAKAVYEYNQSHADKITFLTYPYDLDPFFNQLVMSALAKDSVSNKDEAIASIKEVYQALEKLAPYKPNEKFINTGGPFALYHDKVLFSYHYSWIYLLWQYSNPTGVRVMHPCEIPSIDSKKSTSYCGVYNCVFVVPKNAKNRKAAEKLMQFISSTETADKWTKYSKCPTGLKIQMAYSDIGTDEYTKFGQHIKEKYHDRLDNINITPRFFNINKSIDYQFINVMNGEITSDDATKNLFKQINAK